MTQSMHNMSAHSSVSSSLRTMGSPLSPSEGLHNSSAIGFNQHQHTYESSSSALAGETGASGSSQRLSPSSASGGGGVVELVQLRLQCESLSRKLAAQSRRAEELEVEQARLQAGNERLRLMLHASAPNGDGSAREHDERGNVNTQSAALHTLAGYAEMLHSSFGGNSSNSDSYGGEGGGGGAAAHTDPRALQVLVADIHQSEAAIAEVRSLLLALNRLFAFLRARADGRDVADAVGVSSAAANLAGSQLAIPFRTIYQPPLNAQQRFGDAASALISRQLLADRPVAEAGRTDNMSMSRQHWNDTRSIELDVKLATAHADELRAYLSEYAVTDIADQCRMQ